MDKPNTLSVKDFLIRKMSVKILLPEYTIDAIISHQFSSAIHSMKNNNSIELSGWGKFLFKPQAAKKRLEKAASQKEHFSSIIKDESLPEHKRKSAEIKLLNLEMYIADLFEKCQ